MRKSGGIGGGRSGCIWRLRVYTHDSIILILVTRCYVTSHPGFDHRSRVMRNHLVVIDRFSRRRSPLESLDLDTATAWQSRGVELVHI